MSDPTSTVGVKNPIYDQMAIEPWDVITQNFTPEMVRGYFIGEALAYLMRYRGPSSEDRGGLRDLKKTRHFIDRLIQHEEQIELDRREALSGSTL